MIQLQHDKLRRYILTGTPGSGKTSLIRSLEMRGASVVNEAATDIISYRQMLGSPEPWLEKGFIDDIIELQKHRQFDLSEAYSSLHFYDRSPVCTHALAKYLGYEPSALLLKEINRILKEGIYEEKVFFIDNLGFIENTNVRRITFAQSLEFEKKHLDSYLNFGFECVHIPPVSIEERVNLILELIH